MHNVKAARDSLDGHVNDAGKFKEAEPWLFVTYDRHAKGAADLRIGPDIRGA